MHSLISDLGKYWQKRSPTIFQQTKSNNLCASLIQKNDVDRFRISVKFEKLIAAIGKEEKNKLINKNVRVKKDEIRNIKSVQQLTLSNIEIPNQNDIVSMPEISPIDALNFDVEKLKQSIEVCVVNRKTLVHNMSELKELKTKEEEIISKLRDEKKIKERTHILLENPDVNIKKIESILSSTKDRIDQLSSQWTEHRSQLLQQLDAATRSTNEQNVF